MALLQTTTVSKKDKVKVYVISIETKANLNFEKVPLEKDVSSKMESYRFIEP